ncbi:hypothetical protein TD95_001970 [Thielaviopsis punctulata]|uniref:BZIP domain-containing protein n=1 Tax=Thielaviopsis punctulata TaxID=72032 RepID=A0A0F4ZBG6_9PEZI|nr:hypothetical protein TD95_001970 [Thielaviopsis punctulata]
MAYSGRRGPNVTRYLRTLNMMDAAPAATEEPYNIESDLALFTNAQFFDFDSGQNTDFQAPPPTPKIDGEPASATTVSPAEINDISSFITGDFNFDFSNTFTTPAIQGFTNDGLSMQQLSTAAPVYPARTEQASQQPQQTTFIQQPIAPQVGEKRKADAMGPNSMNLSFEERSRLAAEEDKRRRNTAASARFRIKKKQREQALEKSAKEMAQKVSELENHIQQLETENKWLRNILLEKNDNNEHIAAILEKGFPGKEEMERVAKQLAAKSAAAATATTSSSVPAIATVSP